MIDLRSSSEVQQAMRQVFGPAAGLPPHLITDDSKLYEARPPENNLGLDTSRVGSLIVDAAGALLGPKLQALFRPDLVASGALTRDRFRPLVDLQHSHFNSLALSAAFIVVCDGIPADPHAVDPKTPIQHVDDADRLRFVNTVEDAIRTRICVNGIFRFTPERRAELMAAKAIEKAIDAVIGGLKDAIAKKGCI